MAGDVQLAIKFKRQYAGNLDIDYTFETTIERMDYLTNARRYPGQMVFDAELEAVFYLNADADAWLAMGGLPSIDDTDDVSEGSTNLYFTENRVRATVLTALSLVTSTAITAADSVLSAFGKLQAQITTLLGRIAPTMAYDGTGLKIPTVDGANAQILKVATVAVHTGFIRTDDTFTMGAILTPGANALTISASDYGVVFSSYFTAGGNAPIDAVKFITPRTVTLNPADPISPVPAIPVGSSTIKYVGWTMPSDTIVFSDTPYVQSPAVCQLGFIFYQNNGGVYEFVSVDRTYINMPDVAAYSNLATTTSGVTSTSIVTPVGGGMAMKHTAGVIKGISVNWNLGGNNDERTVTEQNPFTFTFRHPASHLSLLVTGVTNLVTTDYWNGTAMTPLAAANNAQVMRVMMSIRGGLVVQPGETQYTTLAAAKENAYAQQYTEVLPKGSYAEICRIAVRKSATNLADLTDASFFVSGAGSNGGGTSGALFASIGGAPRDNTLLDSELDAHDAAIALKLPIASPLTTGTALTFVTDSIYGHLTAETGNITASTTGAVPGVTNLVIHNSGTEPTFDSKFVKLNSSRVYALGDYNYIYCQYINSTKILYTISQEA